MRLQESHTKCTIYSFCKIIDFCPFNIGKLDFSDDWHDFCDYTVETNKEISS